MVVEGKKVFVNPDCYFEKVGQIIDNHPIGGIGIYGPKNQCLVD